MTYITSPQPAQGQMVFVRKTGNDITGDGSADYPYLTINQALTSITDNSSSKRYKIDVGPGAYTETHIALKPNVWIVGCGQEIGGPCRVAVSNPITVDSSWNVTTGARGGISNIYFNGTTQLSADLTSTGHTSPTILELKNVTFNGAVTYKAIASGDGIDWRGGETFGTVTLIGGGSNTLQGVFCFGDIVLADGTGIVQGFQMFNGVVGGNTTVSALSGNVVQVQFIGSNVGGNFTQTQTNGTLTTYFDSGSYPNGTVTINSGTLTRTSPSTGIAYTPSVNGNWKATVPTTVQAALDQLSSRVTALSG